MLSEDARQTRQRDLGERQQTLQQRTAELESQANQRRQELLQPILDRVQAEIENLRAEQGYVMIFDASAAGLIAADPALDVTDQVIARLQALGPASSVQP
jgi:outer membrane protein